MSRGEGSPAGQDVTASMPVLDSHNVASRPADAAGAKREATERAAEADAARARHRLGRYCLLEPLGRGGMGVVWRAWDPALRRVVAVKVIRTDRRKRSPERLAARLAREAQALARLAHPNVVPVYDVGEDLGLLYVAMAFVDGWTLRRWLRAAPRSPAEIARVIRDAARGLAAAHAAGIVHRDVKPGNILITRSGRAYVADFGLARTDLPVESGDELAETQADSMIAAAAESGSRHGSRHGSAGSTLTDHRAALGTLPYMAPEQHSGRPLDGRADQYALCITLWEALYGSRPFAHDSARGLLAKKIAAALPAAPPAADVPRWLHRLVLRGLSPRTSDRYESMLALAHAIDRGLRPRKRPALRATMMAGGASALLLGGVALHGALPTRCDSAADLAQVWGPAQRELLSQGLDETGLPYASDAARRVRTRVDEWTAAWKSTHDQVCATSKLPAPADARLACLERGRQALAGLAGALETPTEAVAAQAIDAALALPDPFGCLTAKPSAPPTFTASAREHEEHRSTLARARSRGRAGDFDAALAEVLTLGKQVDTRRHAGLAAEVLIERGRLEEALGWKATAERTLTEAYWLAHDHEEAGVAGQAATELVRVVGRHWPDRALSWSERVDEDARPVTWWTNTGQVLGRLGRARDAVAHLSEAVDRCNPARAQQALECARASHGLGRALDAAGHAQGARAHLDEARRIHQRRLGPSHPMVADDLAALGEHDRREGDHHAALAELRRALVLRSSSGEGLGVAQAHLALATTLRSMGREEEAHSHLGRALEIRRSDLPRPTVAAGLRPELTPPRADGRPRPGSSTQ